MRLTFYYSCTILDAVSGGILQLPHSLHGVVVTQDRLADYLDSELADAGVIGGEIRLDVNRRRCQFAVVYWIPESFLGEHIERLESYTSAQFDDGIGEDGFPVEVSGTSASALADTEAEVSRELVDDGHPVPTPSSIAISARNGDRSTLKNELSVVNAAIDGTHQGYTGLHLSILHGHVECAELLMERGADPNCQDPQGATALHLVAVSSALDDDQSCFLTEVLLASGAESQLVDSTGETAKSLATARDKKKMAALLLET